MTTLSRTAQIPSAASHAPSNPHEVASAVAEARAKDLRLAVVATGHGLNPLGDLRDSLVLDLNGLDSIEIDSTLRTARIGGSVTWRDLLEATTPLGLTAPFGTAGTVGVTGYSLGGGVGPLGRHLGLGASAIRAADLVTAGGDLIRVDQGSDPELLWALKGGGGGLGVVTSLDIDLAPMPDMTAGLMVWPAFRAPEVAHTWARWTRSVPADLTSSLRMVQTAPGEGLILIMVASPRHVSEASGQIEDLASLDPIVNTVGTTDPSRLIAEHGDPDADGPDPWIEHTLIDRLPVEAVEAAIEFADPARGSKLLMAEFRHLGGALASPAKGGGALDHLDGEYCFFAMGTPEAKPAVSHAVNVISDFGRGRNYLNFALESVERSSIFDAGTVARLERVYDRIDPERFFVQPHPF